MGEFVVSPGVLTGEVIAVCTSAEKGVRKQSVDSIELEVGTGVVGDAHSGAWHRQVSLLPDEAVDELRQVLPNLKAGDFAENILTRGLDLKSLPGHLRRGDASRRDANRQEMP